MGEIDRSADGANTKRRRIGVLVALLVGFSALAQTADAQTPPTALPPAVEPGLVPQQFQPQQGREKPPEITVPAAPTNVPPPGTEAVELKLKKIVVEGSTVYSPEELAKVTAPYTNRTITVADLFSLANKITEKYRSAGYILSRAVVPAQHLNKSAGVARIAVIEGFVSSYKVQGYDSALIRAYARKIAQSRPLRAGVLERFMLLANDLPGVSAHAVLSPAPKVEGGSILTIEAKHKLVDGTLATDNRGTDYIGPYQLYAGVGVNIPGWDSRLAARYITTPSARELQYGELSYEQPLGSDGLRLTLYGNYFKTNPRFTLAPFNVRSHGSTFSATLMFPFIRRRSENLEGHVELSARDLITHVNNNPSVPPSSDDHLRIFRAGLRYDFADEYGGVNLLRFDFSHGLPILGASAEGYDRQTPSRTGARSDFTKYTAEISRHQDLHWIYPGLSILAAATGQLAGSGALPSSEQFSLGGPRYGRAYPPSDVIGDNGWAAKTELQYTAVPPQSWQSWLTRYQLYTFYDLGRVTRDVSSVGSPRLSSGGFGVRLDIANRITADLEAAKPLSRDPSIKYGFPNARPWHFFFSVAMTF